MHYRNVDRVNTLKTRYETNEAFNRDWEKSNEKYSSTQLIKKESRKQVEEE